MTQANMQSTTPSTIQPTPTTKRRHISWSQINLMRTCPRKYAFQYIEDARPALVGSSLIFGSAIHTALEHWFQCHLEGMPVDVGYLFEQFQQEWSRRDQGDIPIRFNKGECAQSLEELALKMLTAFVKSDLAQPDGKLVAVEEELRGQLIEDAPDVLARVDLVWQSSDGLHLIDFKTSRSRWSESRAQESAEQLLLYAHLAKQIDSRIPIQLHFGILTKAKTPAIQLLDVEANAGKTTQILVTMQQVWQAIDAGHFYPNPHPMHCSTCAYKHLCPAHAK